MSTPAAFRYKPRMVRWRHYFHRHLAEVKVFGCILEYRADDPRELVGRSTDGLRRSPIWRAVASPVQDRRQKESLCCETFFWASSNLHEGDGVSAD
jgi:hypothetical protein